ncbi:MAG: tetratricopeptide repeat protein, partial [Candidatus Latescibacterota bacterium]
IIRMLREQEPPRPSTRVSTLGERRSGVAQARRTLPTKLTGELRGDLDWITMKALEKDRTRRYGSAAELAEDVRRHLRHEPVRAGPPSAAYRARKFVRRHRTGVAFAAVVVFLLASFGVTMTLQAIRIVQERDRANVEADAAREVTDFLVGLFDVSDPRVARGDTITAREILEVGATKVGYELREQPLLRARMMEAMGRVYQNLADYDQADQFLQQALDMRQTHLGERHPDVAKSLSALGYLRKHQGEFGDGKALAEQALSIQRDALPPDHIDTAWSLYYLGSIEGRMGEFSSAREHLENARAIFEKREGPYSLAVSWCLQDLAGAYGAAGDGAKRLEYYKRALEVKKRILPADHPDLALSIEGVGMGLATMGDYAGALTALNQALEIFENSLGSDHFDTALCNHSIGWTLRLAGRFDEAKPFLEQALEAYRLTLGEEHDAVANVLDELGLVEHHAGRHAEAESLYAKALPMMEKALAPGIGNANLIGLLEHRAVCLRELDRQAQAESLEARARAIQEALDRQRNDQELH